MWLPEYSYIVVLLLLLLALSLLFYSKSQLASDQRIHLLFINLIRKNHHRMIRNCDGFLIHPKMSYPQLLHWAFSFISNSRVTAIGRLLPFWFALFSLLAFLLFVAAAHDALFPAISRDQLILTSGLLFVTLPFTYNINNAKNIGVSARGLGLLLGQVFTYCVVLYVLKVGVVADTTLLAVATLAIVLIFLSSQFASQYVLFISALLAVLYADFSVLLPVILAFVIFFLAMPVIAWQFFTGNLGHKKFYFRFLSAKLLLSYRESIWKDVFYEIWALLIKGEKPRGGGTVFMYIYNNPVVLLVFSLPLVLPFVAYLLINSSGFGYFSTDFMGVMGVPIIASVALFLLFSFRSTRFLGEPERYVEFAAGFSCLAAAILLRDHPVLLWGIITFQILFVVAQALIGRKRLKTKYSGMTATLARLDAEIALRAKAEEIRLLSNNTEVMRSLADGDRKIFYGSLYSEWYGKFHYADLYKTFDEMKGESVWPVIREFQINYFVLDANLLQVGQFLAMADRNHGVRQISVEGNLILYHIQPAT